MENAVGKNEKVVIVTGAGALKDTPFADKLASIVADSLKAEKTNTVMVVDINVPEVTNEILLKIREEKEGVKEFAQNAGAKLAQIEKYIAKLEKDPDVGLSKTGKELLQQLYAEKKKILDFGDEAAQARICSAQLLEEIRTVDTTNYGDVKAMVARLVKAGRYHIAVQAEIDAGKAGKWPSGTLFFEGKAYISSVGAEGKTGYQKALEAETRKVLDMHKCSRASAMTEKGNPDLAGFEAGKFGTYYMYSPKRTEGDRKYSEGHALVEIRDVNKGKQGKNPYVVVEVRDASGSLTWMKGGKYIPFFWVEKGRVITKADNRLEKDDFDSAARLIRTLRALVAVWEKAQKPTPTLKEGEGYTVGEADMTEVKVVTVGAKTDEAPAAPAEEIPAEKPKKAKKASKK